MIQSLIGIGNRKSLLAILFLFSILVVGAYLLIQIQLPDKSISRFKQYFSWAFWIIAYISAQIMVAVFVGREIRGSDKS